MPSFSSAEYAQRIEALQQHLVQNGIELAVINQTADIYYYSGSAQPLYLLVPAQGEAIVLARKAVTRITDEVTHLPFASFASTKDLVDILRRYNMDTPACVGYTLDTTAYATVTRFQRLFGDPEIADLSWDIRVLRMVKSPAEIAIQSRASAIMANLPQLLQSFFRPGMTELELSAELERYFRLQGHGALVRCRREGIEVGGFGVCSAGVNSLAGTKFDGICSGAGLSSALPYGAADQPIPRGVPIILDYAFNLEGYIIDQTRMCSWGMPSDEAFKAYQAMCQVESAIIDALVPGQVWEDIYQQAVALADEYGYADTFMGVGTERVKFVGHGVGLELDEPPYLAPQMKYRLAPGMVLAVEPKVALPNLGVIGPEDTLIIRETGAERLTNCPLDFIIL